MEYVLRINLALLGEISGAVKKRCVWYINKTAPGPLVLFYNFLRMKLMLDQYFYFFITSVFKADI